MAEFLRWQVSITTMDGVLRPSVNTFNIDQADAQEYVDAADDAARAASNVGDVIAKFLAMTDGSFVKAEVGISVVNDPVTNPADSVLRGNKLLFHCRAGGRGLVFEVPSRKVASYTQSVDSRQVSITVPTAMSNFVGAVNSFVRDMFGNIFTVVSAEIVD